MPYLVGVTALLFTVLSWAHVRWTVQANDQLRAENAAQQVIDTINDRMSAQIGVLRAAAGLFAADDDVTRSDFRQFVARLDLPRHYPGTLGVGYSQRVAPDALQGLVNKMASDGVKDFRVWPDGERDEYHAIMYLEPLDRRNQIAIGYDMTTDATRRAAMERARDSGDAVASGKVELVQERDDAVKQAGFLIYVPVYRGGDVPATVPERRERLLGFVYSPLRADDLLEGIFINEVTPLVDIRVYDSRANESAAIMHDSVRLREGDLPFEPRVRLTRSMSVAGRPWTILFDTRPTFDQTSERHLAAYILVSGGLISILLFSVSMSQRRSATRAEQVAEQLRFSQSSLRESEQRFRAMFNQAAVGMAQVDTDGRFLSVNQRLCDITGYSDDELLRMSFFEITHPEDRERDQEQVRRVLAGEIDDYTLEKRYIRQDGRVVWVKLARSVVRDATGRVRYSVVVMEDVTVRRLAEEELQRHRDHLEHLVAERTAELETSHERLRQTERMAALGTLSTGLGHDMGNLLLPIRLRLATMASKGIPPQFAEDVEAIRKSCEYLQQLANGLRLLALDPDDERASERATDLHTWWNDARALLRNALPRGVQLEGTFPAGGPGALLAKHLLTQAVFNLVQNAGDAMRSAGMTEGGNVTVWAEYRPGASTLEVIVRDNGPGMSDEVRRRCLEPFFTTKTRGISTGLGLALVHGIVQKAGGSVEVRSEAGRGAMFRLTLPAVVREAPSEASPAQPKMPAAVSLSEPRRRAYVISVLNGLGFDVLTSDVAPEHATAVWVVDDGGGGLDRARRYVHDQPGRRAIVFTDEPLASLNGHVGVRIQTISPAAKPTAIWQAARDVARDLSMQPA